MSRNAPRTSVSTGRGRSGTAALNVAYPFAVRDFCADRIIRFCVRLVRSPRAAPGQEPSGRLRQDPPASRVVKVEHVCEPGGAQQVQVKRGSGTQ